MSTRSQRHVLVGVTGGIAAYKTAELVSRLIKRGDLVTVAMTDAATRFIGVETFSSLSGRPVLREPWGAFEDHESQHVALAGQVDIMVVSPCSMNSLSKFAAGFASDMVSLLVAAIDRAETPVLLAPSMNAAMWNQPATQRHVATLQQDGFTVLMPETGWQACRTEGCGRLPETSSLIEAIDAAIIHPQSS